MNPVLLPCPCCGAAPKLYKVDRVFDSSMYIECPWCGLRSSEAAYYSADQLPSLVKEWPDLDEENVTRRLAVMWNIRVPVQLASRSPSRPFCSPK